MILTFQTGKRIYEADCTRPIDLAIPMSFSDAQPNVHGIGKAYALTHEIPGLVGDTRRGGSCNWQQYTLTPHSNGTHTESVGHIIDEPFPINQTLRSLLIPTTLITVATQKAEACSDSYIPSKKPEDLLITRQALEEKLKLASRSFCQGIAIRTLPNGPDKLSRDYQLNPPPYFSSEAMEYLVSLNVEHLLVDIPSIDRLHDEGKMHNHRLFWNIPLGIKHLSPEAYPRKTITELMYAPESVADGIYALNLQIPSFATDAAPSRPLLFPVRSRHD